VDNVQVEREIDEHFKYDSKVAVIRDIETLKISQFVNIEITDPESVDLSQLVNYGTRPTSFGQPLSCTFNDLPSEIASPINSYHA